MRAGKTKQVGAHITILTGYCRDVTDHLQLLLRKSGHHLHTTAEREVVRTIKEKCCYVALNPAKEEKDSMGRSEEFRLPDGNTVQLGPERFRAPEILFNPELIGQEYAGVHQVVVDSINRVDLDLRKSLFSNIVLSGGSTLCKGLFLERAVPVPSVSYCIAGFGDRLLNEVKKLALKDVKIKIYAPPERKYSTWIGGSILAGLNTFKKVCLRSLPGLRVAHRIRRCGCQRKSTRRTPTSFTRSWDSERVLSLLWLSLLVRL